MKNLNREQFIMLYKNTLLVADFESDLADARSSMKSRFENASSKNRLLSNDDKAASFNKLGSNQAKVTDRNISILADVVFGVKLSLLAKEHSLSPSRVAQIVNSELARFKHPLFQRIISSPKVIDKYESTLLEQLSHLPNNETVSQMLSIIKQSRLIEAGIVELRKSYIQNLS